MTITLKKVSVGTELQIVQEGVPDVIPAEACYLGWQESLTLLAKLVEAEIPDSGCASGVQFVRRPITDCSSSEDQMRVLLSVRFVAGRDDCSSGTGLPTRGVVDESSLGSRVRRPVPPWFRPRPR